jgi:hypothetical protein
MASILLFLSKAKYFVKQIYGNNCKILNNRQPLKKFSIHKMPFFVVHNVQPLLQVPRNFNFRSLVTISRDGVMAPNKTSLPITTDIPLTRYDDL